jgi:hypothetical protein
VDGLEIKPCTFLQDRRGGGGGAVGASSGRAGVLPVSTGRPGCWKGRPRSRSGQPGGPQGPRRATAPTARWQLSTAWAASGPASCRPPFCRVIGDSGQPVSRLFGHRGWCLPRHQRRSRCGHTHHRHKHEQPRQPGKPGRGAIVATAGTADARTLPMGGLVLLILEDVGQDVAPRGDLYRVCIDPALYRTLPGATDHAANGTRDDGQQAHHQHDGGHLRGGDRQPVKQTHEDQLRTRNGGIECVTARQRRPYVTMARYPTPEA